MKIIAGNWKMNGTREQLENMYTAIAGIQTENKIIICPPFTLISVPSPQYPIPSLGAQDCSTHDSGAYTGEVSASMIAETGAKYIIVGHSERRQYHGETNEIVRTKAEKALAADLTPIICVGETLAQRESGTALDVIREQIENSIPSSATSFIIAYEPVWAIGTGLTPTIQQITEMHAHMRTITTAPLLYGGSVKAANAAEIMSIPNVDGVLVGGASLKPDDFLPIITAL